MSKYTTEVRFICENYAGLKESVDYHSVGNVIEKARGKVFDFEFPIYDESYRGILETKILKHYYTREIGFETVALWKLWLDKRLNEIMPYYNQLYKSTTLEFNPFYDVDLTTDSKRNIDHDEATSETGTSKMVRDEESKEVTDGTNKRTDNLSAKTDNNTVINSENSASGSNENTRSDNLAHADTTNTSSNTMVAYSDTPQGALTGVQNLNYLTTATQTTATQTVQNNGTETGTVRNEGSERSSENGTTTTKGEDTVTNTGTQTVDSDVTVNKSGTQTDNGNTQDNGTRTYTNIDDYLEHVKGKRGSQSYAELLMQYRKTFLNIDMQIIDELEDLFMNLW